MKLPVPSIPSIASVIRILGVIALVCGGAVAEDPDRISDPVPVPWAAATVHDLDFKVQDETYLITTTGNDPFLRFELPAAKMIDRDWFLSMETFCTEGVSDVHFYPGVRFQVMRQTADQIDMVSAARYPDQLDPARARSLPPPPALRAAKGLTCLDVRFTSAQIRDLGLRHGSVSVVMNDLIRKTPAHGYEPIIHPDADPAGVYAMPNLTTGEGVDVFTLTCDFLADRYSQSDDIEDAEGTAVDRRIDLWIVHNEVDAGWSWTNIIGKLRNERCDSRALSHRKS